MLLKSFREPDWYSFLRVVVVVGSAGVVEGDLNKFASHDLDRRCEFEERLSGEGRVGAED